MVIGWTSWPDAVATGASPGSAGEAPVAGSAAPGNAALGAVEVSESLAGVAAGWVAPGSVVLVHYIHNSAATTSQAINKNERV